MSFLKVFAVLLVIGCAFAEEEKLPEACAVEDIPCFNKFNKEFLAKTAGGIPKYGLKAIDPLVIPSFEITIDDATADYKNLKVTGLKNEEIVDVKLDKAVKTMTIAAKQNLKIEGDFDLTLTEKSEKRSGKLSATTDVLLTATYNYELKTDDKGVQHFHILSNTFKCEPSSVKFDLGEELENAMKADPEQTYTDKEREEVEKIVVCKILEKSVETLNENFKVTADYYPASAFFKNL